MAPRTTRRTSDALTYGFWLVFDSDGGVRLTRTQPNVSRNERAMSLEATLPLSLFATPVLRAEITVAAPEGAAARINLDAAAQAMRQALGVDVDLRIEEADHG